MKKLLLFTMFATLLSIAFVLGNTSPAQAYSNDNIISDQLFRDKDSMTKKEIQSFLDARGGALASWSGGDAAQIIYDASQDFGVSPKVIMATLQKEQSLITDPNPHHTQYDFAMGYGCPTTGSCSFPGFESQVRNGTWQLRLNYERARGNDSWWRSDINYACAGDTAYYKPGLFPGNTVRFYDHVKGQHYATVKIANAATASMYCYTPHVYNPSGDPTYYSGSYNFVTFYERYWGSTTFPTTVKIIGDEHPSRVYLVWRDHYYHIGSSNTLKALGLDSQTHKSVSKSDLDGFERGPRLKSLVKFTDTPSHAYMIDDAGLYRFPSRELFEQDYRFGDPGDVTVYPESLRSFFWGGGTMANVIRAHGEATAYAIEGGEKRHIASREALDTLGDPIYGTRSSARLSKSFISRLNDGAPIIKGSIILKSSDTNNYYLHRTGEITPVEEKVFKEWGISSYYSRASQAAIEKLSQSNKSIDTRIAHDGSYYLAIKGKLRLVDEATRSNWGLAPEKFETVDEELIAKFTIGEKATNLIRIDGSNAIYKVANGKYHHIATREAFDGYGHKMSDVMNISYADYLDDGVSTLHARGQLIREAGTAPVYIVTDEFEKRRIPSREIFESYGFSFDEVRPVNSFQGYSELNPLTNLALFSNKLWLVDRGNKHLVDPALIAEEYYGWQSVAQTEILPETFQNLKRNQDLTTYVRGVADRNPVFRVRDGEKRQYSSRSALEEDTDWDQIIQLSDSILNTLSTGEPI